MLEVLAWLQDLVVQQNRVKEDIIFSLLFLLNVSVFISIPREPFSPGSGCDGNGSTCELKSSVLLCLLDAFLCPGTVEAGSHHSSFARNLKFRILIFQAHACPERCTGPLSGLCISFLPLMAFIFSRETRLTSFPSPLLPSSFPFPLERR